MSGLSDPGACETGLRAVRELCELVCTHVCARGLDGGSCRLTRSAVVGKAHLVRQSQHQAFAGFEWGLSGVGVGRVCFVPALIAFWSGFLFCLDFILGHVKNWQPRVPELDPVAWSLPCRVSLQVARAAGAGPVWRCLRTQAISRLGTAPLWSGRAVRGVARQALSARDQPSDSSPGLTWEKLFEN